MAMVPGGGGGGEDDGGAWTESMDNVDAGGPEERMRDNPAFCLFKGAADGLAGGLMGSVFGFGN